MNRAALAGMASLGFGGALLVSSPAWAACHYDLNGVGYGYDGSVCPYRGGNGEGRARQAPSDDGQWRVQQQQQLLRQQQAAQVEQQRLDEQRRQEEAAARRRAADQAYQEGLAAGGRADWAAAIAAFDRALGYAPNDPAILAQEKRARIGLRDSQAAERIRGAREQVHADLQNARSAAQADSAADAASAARSRRMAEEFRRSLAQARQPVSDSSARSAFGTKIARPSLPDRERKPDLMPGADTNAGRQLQALADWAKRLLGLPETQKFRSGNGFDDTSSVVKVPGRPTLSSAGLSIPDRMQGDPDVVKLRNYEAQLGRAQAEVTAAQSRYETERARSPTSPKLTMLRFEAHTAQDKVTNTRGMVTYEREKVAQKVTFNPVPIGAAPAKAKP